jgi:hypothetical protein
VFVTAGLSGASVGSAGLASAQQEQGDSLLLGHLPVSETDPHHGHTPFDVPPIADAKPSSTIRPGTIRVEVVDGEGHPVPQGSVLLGILSQGGERRRMEATTDAAGVVEFRELATGSGQAYRVNVPFEGATYSSAPFQLPPDRGYEVRITRLPVTHDDRTVLQVIGQTFVEIRDERLHVIQQAQLANLSRPPRAYVFPAEGLRVRLPQGFLAFQAQPVMTDQRVEAMAGDGMRIRGSLPPGRVTLTWAFDLPITGSDMTVQFPVPFRTYIYRVITDAPPGLRLTVDPLPPVQQFEDEGRVLFGTELERRPGDPPLTEVTLRFQGIPGPGPLRWIAVGLAIVLVLGGIGLAIQGGDPASIAARSREARKRELLEEAAALEEDFVRGKIGPRYRQMRRDAIVRELALLLYQERSTAQSKRPGASRV